jgi:hypothetical protein
LLFAHPEIRPNLFHDGLPIILSAPFTQSTHGQLNNRWEFSTVANHLHTCGPQHRLVASGDVLSFVNRAMRLTCGKLLKQFDWNKWQESEYLQLDQNYDQGMLGTPKPLSNYGAVFLLVWRYNNKALDGQKKACCACNGSPRTGQACVLDETYANCVNQMSSRIFYTIAVAEKLLIFGAMSPTHSQRPHLSNRDSSSAPTVPLWNGGHSTGNIPH